MTSSKDNTPLAGSPADYAHTLARAGIASIPIVGAAAAELFNMLIGPPICRRRDKWIETLADGLKALERKVTQFRIERLAQDESFVSTVMHASQVVIRNHLKEKLEALRNAVLNSALPSAPEEHLRHRFLHLIDVLTPWHVRTLRLLQESPLATVEDYHYGVGNPSDGLMDVTQEALESHLPALQSDMLAHRILPELLHEHRLLCRHYSYDEKKRILSHEAMGDAVRYAHFGPSRLGSLFLRFIASPDLSSHA